nr:464_t:CDS:2 [Entrophospora candida]
MDEAARRQYCGLLIQFIIDETELQMRPSLRKTPRPPNAFILYRREKQPEITAHYGNITNSKISKILAKMWRNEKDDIKMHWQRLADRKKMEHSQAHPGYVFSPKKSSNSRASASTAAINRSQNENLNLNSSSSLNPSLSPSLSSDIKFEFKHRK